MTRNDPETPIPNSPETVQNTKGADESIANSTAKTAERAYYHQGNFFIKRSIRPSEYLTTLKGTKHIPRLNKERLQNEAAAMSFIRQRTNILVPTLCGAFEIDESFMLITEHLDGVAMSTLPEEQKAIVHKETEQHLATLRSLRSDTMGGPGPSRLLIPPYLVMYISKNDDWKPHVSKEDEYVFCHEDLAQHNIIEDPESLKIRAILDREYAGFFPEVFEGLSYKRWGPSVALDGERDDAPELLAFLELLQISGDQYRIQGSMAADTGYKVHQCNVSLHLHCKACEHSTDR